eukprot:TRINITY_DN18426_c0_g1_i2.p2 TRINITY_DN18426_c0_g1~~TRINITY_DN18426_c0_g1_i2.p2  ORF type:complete len:177 (+),score=3.45 TRINITY_DN18426_c0_g1_i2:427-957(+)
MLIQNFSVKRSFKLVYPIFFQKRIYQNQKMFKKRIKFQCKSCFEDQNFESKAGEFLKNYGIIEECLKQVNKTCPEVFQLTTYEIGCSILYLKQAGITDDEIIELIELLPQVLFLQFCSYFVDVYNLMSRFFNMVPPPQFFYILPTQFFQETDLIKQQVKISKIESTFQTISKFGRQ